MVNPKNIVCAFDRKTNSGLRTKLEISMLVMRSLIFERMLQTILMLNLCHTETFIFFKASYMNIYFDR